MIDHRTQVLVVGTGGAGLRAALAAKEAGSDVLILSKGKLGQSGVTATACSDRMAFHATLPHTPPLGSDAWKHHADDIYRLGGFVSDADLAEVLARNSADAFFYLDKLGVPFAKTEKGLPSQFLTDGSRYPRACFTGPYTARDIEAALVKEIQSQQIPVLEEVMAIDLVLADGRVVGLLAVDLEGKPIAIQAAAVVLATGGAGDVYSVNVYPKGMTGDGYAMALRAGAELVNMEFIQIGLSSVVTKLACSGSMMRAIPRFVNARGEEILSKYINADPEKLADLVFRKGASWPVSNEHDTRAIDIAVFKEEMLAQSPVSLDYSSNPSGLAPKKFADEIARRYASIGVELLDRPGLTPLDRIVAINRQAVDWLKQRGIDVQRGDKVEIAPAIQHFQGGVKIRRRAETKVEGLFAAGEAAGGQHGANRPGGNALLDSQVFGKIAGLSAAERSKLPKADLDSLAKSAKAALQKRLSKGASASSAKETIRALMPRYAGVLRTKRGLAKAWKKLEEFSKQGIKAGESNPWEAAEAENMLLVAKAVVKAAMLRDESRGPHLLFDSEKASDPLPRNDQKWSNYIALSLVDGELKAESKEPVRPAWAIS